MSVLLLFAAAFAGGASAFSPSQPPRITFLGPRGRHLRAPACDGSFPLAAKADSGDGTSEFTLRHTPKGETWNDIKGWMDGDTDAGESHGLQFAWGHGRGFEFLFSVVLS